MRSLLIAATFLCGGAIAQGTSKLYPPGWNKEATKPPMGWRSWNAFGNRIDEKTFEAAVDAITARVWNEPKVSLADAGYVRVGIDEGWENCSGADPAGGMRQHDEAGFPLINVERFPDMKRLVAYGHSKGVKMGWYLNGCACGEAKERLPNYRGDVQRLAEFGFDAVKIDGCGAATNMTFYAQLMAQTNKTYEIENCHWGVCGADRKFHNPDGASCPTEGWCPFNHFRTSGDINAGPMSWFANLQTTVRFLDASAPLSRPSCWAYPDMLEVGRVQGASFAWQRAHFGAWCVVSAPLVLGLDLTDTANLASVVPIVTNPEAIAVNQQWAGHPGRLVAQFDPPAAPPAAPAPAVRRRAFSAGEASAGEGRPAGEAALPSAAKAKVQVWAKPQPKGTVAVYVVNPAASGNAARVSVGFEALGLAATSASVRDLWARQEAGHTKGATLTVEVAPLDSAFLLLTPAAA